MSTSKTSKEKLSDELKKEIGKEALKEHYKKNYQRNKKIMNQTSTKYYEANKEELNKKIECKCGGTYVRRNKALHEKSKMHVSYLKGKKDALNEKEKSEESSSNNESSDSEDSD